MENVRIAFVVLHYQAIEETIKCIETIEKKVGIEEYKIIVVDNNTTNGNKEEDVIENPKTGSSIIYIVILLVIISIPVSIFAYKKYKKRES